MAQRYPTPASQTPHSNKWGCARLSLSQVQPTPTVGEPLGAPEAAELAEALEQALFAAKVCAYAQGFGVIRAASEEYGWGVTLAELARIWRGGCIIRARLLDQIRAAFQRDPQLSSLLLDDAIAAQVCARKRWCPGWGWGWGLGLG